MGVLSVEVDWSINRIESKNAVTVDGIHRGPVQSNFAPIMGGIRVGVLSVEVDWSINRIESNGLL